ncbi:hypothetical protein ABT234_20885 [Streptomyces sp. NPDC001586]|uniref:hypothetical protein n=1 Tax=Streptomyces sp. NPDC001586 TaxID=3154387 RepID=UPI00331C50D0
MTRTSTTALALREDALNPFDADQRSRIPAAAGLAAVTPAAPANPAGANLRNPALVEACRRSDLPPLTSRAIAVLVDIADMKIGQPANFVAFLDLLASLIWEAGDSEAVLAEVAALISTERAR